MHPSITPERIANAVSADDNLGFCTACGDDASNVEPDARKYKCHSCGEFAVFGAEELLFHVNDD